MRYAEGAGHGCIVSKTVGASFLVVLKSQRGYRDSIERETTFSLPAVSGSIIDRTSLTN